MGYRAASWISKTVILTATGWGLFTVCHRGLAQTVASGTIPATLASQNLWLIAALLSLWLFIPLIATVIISILAFRISPSEVIEAEGDNVINVMPGLKFKARGPMASFIILLALSSLIVLTQIGNVIPTLDNQIEIDKLQNFLVDQEIVGQTDRRLADLDLDTALEILNDYLTVTKRGLNPWTLNTKVGMYNPNSLDAALMSDSAVRQIMDEKTLSVHVESVPKVEPPYGTNVTIEKLLYFPIGAKSIDDIRRAIEDSNDGINLGFNVVKAGQAYRYHKSANLKVMSLNNQLTYQESKVGQGSPAVCDSQQEGLTLSINFDERRMWLGPCILLDYASAQASY